MCHPITATLYAYLYLVFIFFYDASKKEEQLSSAVDCNKRKKTRIEQQLTTHGIVSILSRSRTVTNFFVVSPLTAGVLKQEQRNSYKSVEIASATFFSCSGKPYISEVFFPSISLCYYPILFRPYYYIYKYNIFFLIFGVGVWFTITSCHGKLIKNTTQHEYVHIRDTGHRKIKKVYMKKVIVVELFFFTWLRLIISLSIKYMAYVHTHTST